MKKCQDCHQEIDKYAIACQYCGKLTEDKERSESGKDSETESMEKKPHEEE